MVFNVQCFINKDFTPTYQDGKIPRLLYVCKADADLTKLPCVMHVHEDRLEILFIRRGKGIVITSYSIHYTKLYETCNQWISTGHAPNL